MTLSPILKTAPRVTLADPPGSINLPFPLPRTHCGFPLGNGLFGVLVWGEERRLCVTVNRADFWDHRRGNWVAGERLFEQLKQLYNPDDAQGLDSPFKPMFHAQAMPHGRARPAFRNTRLPMGRFELQLQRGVRLVSGSLDVERGELRVWVAREAGTDAEVAERDPLRIVLHPQKSALLIHDPEGVVVAVTPRPAWAWVGEAMRSRGYDKPVVIDEHVAGRRHDSHGERRDIPTEGGLCGWAQAVPDDSAMAAMCRRHDDAWVIAMMPGVDASEAQSHACDLIQQVRQDGWAAFRHEVHDWWAAYWRGLPRVTLPDTFFNDFLKLALFKFGAATNPQSTTPCGLQGPWCEEYQLPPWSGDYHFNVNIQQIYTLALPTGKVEHLLPLFDMLERCLPLFREQAKSMVGVDDGILITHTTDDRGYACGGIGPGASIDQAVSGWTAMLYWRYYQHTGDRTFLRQRAMPFMAGAMRVFEAMLDCKDGKPSLPIGISAEYGKPLPEGTRQRVGPNPSYQFACMHMLCEALIEGAQALGEQPRPSWRTIRQSLPPFTQVGAPGEERIAIWQDTDLDISHRHHSHLACIYPFDTLSQRTPEVQAIVERSLERWLEIGMSDWSEWCLPWAAIIQAREGYTEGPHLLLKLCRDLFVNEGLATVYIPRFPGFTLHGFRRKTGPLENSEIMQLDGTMGMATALYEMLVHTHRGMIRFFPAVPEAWRDVSFEDIHLPGLLMAGGEKRHGQVQRIALRSESGGQVRIDVPGYRLLALRRGGACDQVTLPATLTLHPGEAIDGTPIP